MLNRLILLIAISAVLACSDQKNSDPPFSRAESLGILTNDAINEASGLEASIKNPGLLWTHNDSGDTARIFLIHENGQDVKTFYLSGLQNRDWEDLTLGPGPEKGENYLYIAEMGDNKAIHEYQYIYRFKEPSRDDDVMITDVDVIRFQYPDGNRDAECLMVDPLTADLYIVSKREQNVHLYNMAYPQSTSETVIPKNVGTLHFHKIVAGDISADGQEIIMKTYDRILYWKRKENNDIKETLLTPPIDVPYQPEPQGESIAWNVDDSGFYTLSEEPGEKEAEVYFYQRK
ncbi:hypothetical protein FNH22_12500 [Fulvivirga sp. M361]|uniref:hypothetical protein n=1 Tax=Fulvivirga sp. M361 TaxID=2594266 RepID=UPI00117B89C6|nr:hypothetical protein [Fulvivirga sp. M361]TRX58692.1 hypothetical protein FNH22_12500 [Fulvivirga sp. M361]